MQNQPRPTTWPGRTVTPGSSGTGEASICMTWPWNGRSAAYGTQETPETGTIAPPPGAAAAVTGSWASTGASAGTYFSSRTDAAMICGCSVRYRPSASGRIPEAYSSCGVRQASAATTTARRGDRRPLAGGQVHHLDTGRPVAVAQHPPRQRAGAQLDVRPLPQVAGDDRRARPVQGTVLADGHGHRHRPDGPAVRPVEELAQHPLHGAGQRRAVEGVRGDGEQLLGAGQRLVEHGGVDAVGHLVVDRARAGRRPVRAHPADVRGHGRVRHGRGAHEHRARPGRGAAGQRAGTGGQLREHAVARLGVGDVLDVPAGGVAQRLPGLEDDDPQAGLRVGELAGDRRPDRAGADDDRGPSQSALIGRPPASASSRRLSMSCCARIWSKAL